MVYVIFILALLVASNVGAAPYEPEAVTASAFSQDYKPEQVSDGDFQTSWRAKGDGQWVQLDLGAIKLVDTILIAWHAGDQRSADFEVVSSVDGVVWEPLWLGSSGGETLGFESFIFPSVKARYVRYVGHGNDKNTWNSLTEFAVSVTFAPQCCLADGTVAPCND